ncbi:hypothetical protein L596_006605 [Steinernema carpocapsae]|uniref:Uncharacterized protein n=1 Tax=Steinernema carpocapsae TaxID=34508 RepID=A0A4U8V9Y3_STECR|nr:hypothetical protein L596_006605 [Steinernema carpocapsae]
MKDDCLFSTGASTMDPFAGPDCYILAEEVSSEVVAESDGFDESAFAPLRALKVEPLEDISVNTQTALLDDMHVPMMTNTDSACSSSGSEEISQPEFSSTLNFNNLMATTPSSCSSPDSLCDSHYSADYATYQAGIYQTAGYVKGPPVPILKDVYGQFEGVTNEEIRCYNNRRLQNSRSRTSMHEMAVRKQLISEQGTTETGTLQLSEEEKRTLVHEGYNVPVFLPSTNPKKRRSKWFDEKSRIS